MARGYPDYNNPFYSIASRSSDFAQGQALAEGLLPLDNLGRMILAENWRNGIEAWGQYWSATRVTLRQSGKWPESNPSCLRFSFVSSLAGEVAYVEKSFGTTTIERWGVEFSLLADAANKDLDVTIEQREGTAGWKFSLRVNLDARTVEVYNGAVWVQVGTVYFDQTGMIYQAIKFAVDFTAHTLERVIIGDGRQDPKAVYGQATAYIGDAFYTVVRVQCTANTGGTNFCHIGHIFVTVDEP